MPNNLSYTIYDLLSEHLKHALAGAFALAESLQSPIVVPMHLWHTLACERGSVAAEILRKAKVKPELLLEAAHTQETALSRDSMLRLRGAATPARASLSPSLIAVMTKSFLLAAEFQHTFVGTEHALCALAESTDGESAEFFTAHHIDVGAIAEYAANVLQSNSKFPEIVSLLVSPEEKNSSLTRTATKEKETAKTVSKKKKTPALDFFTIDLTSQAESHAIDPVIGREKEIDRLITILCRRTKNNPVLLGDPGVGKTAIVEGLAERIVQGQAPVELHNKRILSLDMGLLIAGTMYRGEFEARLKQVIDEVKNDPNVILFIDELHTIVGTGGSGGSLDAANILKPALARGALHAIGATTNEEYKKYIENDPALERRFQAVIVSEPTPDETVAMLKGIVGAYEEFHGVQFSDEAIRAAVAIADRYLTDKFFPDKAIDLMDEAATRVRVETAAHPALVRIKKIEAELNRIREQKERAASREKFDNALALKQKEDMLERERARLIKKTTAERARKPVRAVTPEAISEVAARMTGLPISSPDMPHTLEERRAALREAVVGQDHVIDAVTTALERARLGLHNPERPLASFIFAGPTGVGKTELAKQLARVIFNDRSAFVRVDMAEFAEGFHVSKLVGAPAGYVGYKESNSFTDKIKRRPHSVILFDEIDKAHPEVFNLFFQMLDEGFLTDAVGKKINFKNTIILMTTTVGAEHYAAPSLGFQSKESGTPPDAAQIASSVMHDLKSRFRAEFLNRLNGVLIFHPLDKTHIIQIVAREMKSLAARLAAREIQFSIDAAALDTLAQHAMERDQGARAVRTVAEQEVIAPLVSLIADKKIKESVAVSVRNNQIIFDY